MATMEGVITGAFARILEVNRERFNAKFAFSRHFLPGLDADTFSHHLIHVVTPIVNKLSPERAEMVAEILFDLSLELMGKDYLGKQRRYPAIHMGWEELLPIFPHLLEQSPRYFIGALTNALYNLSQIGRPLEWLNIVKTMSFPDITTFMDVGKILAWRCGMAHYRESALAVCRSLNATWVIQALGVPEGSNVMHLLDRLTLDPWASPIDENGDDRALHIVKKVSAFRGFGGVFMQPPTVRYLDGCFVVFDGNNSWQLHADVFGATLHRLDDIPTSKPSENSYFHLDKNGTITHQGIQQQFSCLANASSYASNATTLAVTLPLSHRVYLVG